MTSNLKYKKHIFICTNDREQGLDSCGSVQGMALVEAFKNLVKQHKLQVEVRAQRAGCLDVCKHGLAMVVYPEGVFYGKVQLEDVQEIFENHILNNTPVDRLQLHF
jgi:(2Fe-2S) ferredoxin